MITTYINVEENKDREDNIFYEITIEPSHDGINPISVTTYISYSSLEEIKEELNDIYKDPIITE